MYDLAIIGAGWAGFNAAIRARSLGLKTCLIENDQIGGTCLNYGCIPTKTLIQSAKIYSQTLKASVFGVELENPKFNFFKAQERKNKLLGQLRLGMESRLKGIDLFKASAELISEHKIKFDAKEVEAKYIILSTGSHPFELPGLEFDGKKIISSNEVLAFNEMPETILIVGGGVIGCEFASLFCALGSKVTLVEKMSQLLPGEDIQVSKKLEVIFKKKGIEINLGFDVVNVNSASLRGVPPIAERRSLPCRQAGNPNFDFNEYSKVLVCVGRRPNVSGLGLERLGFDLSSGKIITDDFCGTHIPNIYAAGDVTGKLMLAHYAAYQGEVCAKNIARVIARSPDVRRDESEAKRSLPGGGEAILSSNKFENRAKADNQLIPNCIYTDPEISSIGLSEDAALAKGIKVNVHKFDFLASGMARILDETEGFIKVISNKETEELLGATIIGPRACELIGIFSVALSSHLKLENLREIIFAHPTLSESIHECLK